MKNNFSTAGRLLVILVLVFFCNIFCLTGQVEAADDKISDEVFFLMQMKDFIKANYVEDVGELELLRGAIKGMVEALDDPYSEYFTPEEFGQFLETTSGNFDGIGVVITLREKYIIVVSTLEGSPAEKAGIRSGDRIIEIDGEDITGFSTAEVVKRLKGEKGTKVSVGIKRDGQDQIFRYEIARDTIKVNPIESVVLGQGIGYIKIREFNENTVENMDKTLEFFKESGVRGIVLDVRNNPGGYLDQAIEIAARFVPKGPIVNIVSSEGKTQTYSSDLEKSPFKLVLLVNGGSASASEILAGAVKDRKAGILVGEKTFGKGMVQRTLSLGTLGGVKLTTAYYTTPNGTNINNTGITPDVVVETDKTNPFKDFLPLNMDEKLSYGNIGLNVMAVQQRLKYLNLLSAQPDGVFGPRTLYAVKTLQKQSGLPVTGMINTDFYNALIDTVYEKYNSGEDIQLRKAIDILKGMLNS